MNEKISLRKENIYFFSTILFWDTVVIRVILYINLNHSVIFNPQ